MTSDNRLYIQDITTAYIMPWQNLPTTFAVEPKLSTRASNISDPGPKAYAFVGRDLGATATIGYTVGHGLYADFCDWHRTALRFGKSWFFILLPSGAGPSWVTARFKEPYTAKPNGGRSWDVTMVVELRERALKVNTVPVLFNPTCFVEKFKNSLNEYGVVAGSGRPFSIVSTPYGNAIHSLDEGDGMTSADSHNTRGRVFNPPILLTSFMCDFQLLVAGDDDAMAVAVTNVASTQIITLNPRREFVFGAAHPNLSEAGGVLDLGSALAINTWFTFEYELQTSQDTTYCTIRDKVTGAILLSKVFEGGRSRVSIDTLEFNIDSIPNLSTTEYANVEVCSKNECVGFTDIPFWLSDTWAVPVPSVGSRTATGHVPSGSTLSSSARSGRANVTFGGPRYFEIVWNSFTPDTDWFFGFCEGRHDKSVRLGTTELGTNLSSGFNLKTSKVAQSSADIAMFPAVVAGQVLMIALDTVQGHIWYGVDGTWVSGTPDLVGGTGILCTNFMTGYQIAVGVTVTSAATDLDASVTLNTLAANVVYPPPDGFLCWDEA